jgi:hypothetical protein
MQLFNCLINVYCTKKLNGLEVIRRQLQTLFPPVKKLLHAKPEGSLSEGFRSAGHGKIKIKGAVEGYSGLTMSPTTIASLLAEN